MPFLSETKAGKAFRVGAQAIVESPPLYSVFHPFLFQVLLNMIDFGMDPQQALDLPRFCINSGAQDLCSVLLEEGISEAVAEELKKLGHKIAYPVCGHDRSVFGRGQIITRKMAPCKNGPDRVVYWSGSDPRADGLAIGL